MRLVSAKTKALVRTVTADAVHPAGRVYFLIEATTEQRYQIPAGAYRVEVQATDSQRRTSNVLQGTFQLNLTPPRGPLRGVHRARSGRRSRASSASPRPAASWWRPSPPGAPWPRPACAAGTS